MDFVGINRFIFFAYGIVFLHFAIAIAIIKDKKLMQKIGAALLLSYGLMCVIGVAWSLYGARSVTLTMAMFTPMLALAPIAESFIHECLGDFSEFRSARIATIAGTVVVWIAVLVLLELSFDLRFSFIIVFAWLSLVFCSIVAHESYALRPIGKMPAGLVWFFGFVLAAALLIVAALVCLILNLVAFAYGLCILLILSVVGVVMLAFRTPQSFNLVRVEVAKIRKARSSLEPSIVEETCLSLEFLMRESRLFRDPDLSLESLVAQISAHQRVTIRSDQLSSIINTRYGKNFPSYVNGFRVEYARTRLVSDSAVSVHEIGLDCGFNSKSVFNDVFRQMTGLTPREYRKDYAAPEARHTL